MLIVVFLYFPPFTSLVVGRLMSSFSIDVRFRLASLFLFNVVVRRDLCWLLYYFPSQVSSSSTSLSSSFFVVIFVCRHRCSSLSLFVVFVVRRHHYSTLLLFLIWCAEGRYKRHMMVSFDRHWRVVHLFILLSHCCSVSLLLAQGGAFPCWFRREVQPLLIMNEEWCAWWVGGIGDDEWGGFR